MKGSKGRRWGENARTALRVLSEGASTVPQIAAVLDRSERHAHVVLCRLARESLAQAERRHKQHHIWTLTRSAQAQLNMGVL